MSSSTVLNEETHRALNHLKSTITAMTEGDVRLTLLQGLDDVLTSVEDHIVSFFGYIRREYGVGDPSSSPFLQRPPQAPPASDTIASLPRLTTHVRRRNSQNPKAKDAKVRAIENAHASVSASLYLMLESLVAKTNARIGAIYLPASDSPDLLRCVASLGDGLPLDVSLASGSSIGTVYTTGVAYNLSYGNNTGKSTEVTSRSNVSLRVRNALCFPVSNPTGRTEESTGGIQRSLGCVLLADSSAKVGFSLEDEKRSWGLCQVLAGLFPRYPLSTFHGPKFDAAYLKSLSILPPATEPPEHQPTLTKEWSIVNSAVGQIIYRTSGKDAFSVKESLMTVLTSSGGGHHEEEAMQDCASYVRSLEEMWRNSIDTNAQLQQEVTRWRSRLDAKASELLSKEIDMKSLVKQFRVIKSDVVKIKTHIREKAFEQGGSHKEGEPVLEGDRALVPVPPVRGKAPR